MPGHRTTGFCATALALALCAVLAGCGGSGESVAGGKIVLRYTWWGNPDRAERTDQAVALFEKEHPNIQVQTSFSDFGSYKQKLAVQATGGDAPDVMQLDYRQIDQYALGHVLLDLGKVKDVLRTDEIDKGLLATGKVGDTLYAIPQGRGTETMVYDVAAWKATGVPLPTKGWTWSDWADSMRALAKKTGQPGGTDPGWSEDFFEVWLRGQGKALYTKDGGLAFTAEDLARYWTFTHALSKEGAVSPAEQNTQLDGSVENTPLGRGKATSDFNWDAPASGYVALVKGGIALAPMPSGTDGTPGQYYKPSMFLGASARTGHPKEAAELIDFLINDEQAAKILGATRGIPVNESVREQTAGRLTDFDKTISDYQASVEGTLKDPPQAPPTGDNSLQTTFQRDYEQVSFDLMSPHAAAKDYITEAKAELRS
ncbi:ABC transporter substrate-binding protein [Streptomyces sp. NPDC005538]|uniref:ABC transporter substrate-binding protein n=1 Tax=unclassified Streptomyces TaxID=2593676 RepID=UPI0033A1150A